MQSTSENMFLELFCQIISEPCFNTLRTKEQLGEFSRSDYVSVHGHAGLFTHLNETCWGVLSLLSECHLKGT